MCTKVCRTLRKTPQLDHIKTRLSTTAGLFSLWVFFSGSKGGSLVSGLALPWLEPALLHCLRPCSTWPCPCCLAGAFSLLLWRETSGQSVHQSSASCKHAKYTPREFISTALFLCMHLILSQVIAHSIPALLQIVFCLKMTTLLSTLRRLIPQT